MNFFERIVYSFTFLFNKYVGFTCTENTLHWFENRMIRKYVSKERIDPISIPTINADESRSSSTVSTLGSPIKKPINDVEAPEVNSTSRNETPVTNEVKVRKEKIQKGGCSACMVM